MKTYRISKLVCFIIGAVAILVFTDAFVNLIRWTIGGLMVLYGVLGILETVLKKEKPIYRGEGFIFFCLEIIMGAMVLIFIEEFSIVCVIWAAWSIFRESIEIKEIVDKKLHPVLAAISGIESIAVIVLSIMLIDSPGHHHALIHTYLLCVELFLSAAIPIINESIFKKHGEKHGDGTEGDAPAQSEHEDTETESAKSEEKIAVEE